MMKKTALMFLAAAIAISASTVPDFSAKDLDGKTWSLDSLLGSKLTIISFWSTSCAPCKEELKLLDSLYGVYGDSGISVVGVNIDSRRTLSRVKPMVKSQGWDFTVLLDPNGDLLRLFKVSPIPHSFYIKPDKELLKSVIGYTKKDAATIIKTTRNAVHGNYSS
ncbi:MAG: TlpA family protein disulfide reductase [Candidatus Stahlbacteria bacterium]|nr:MAG: TlpA family protein disulfide reductase [Candidatus Stahlbacteria bacterium]